MRSKYKNNYNYATLLLLFLIPLTFEMETKE